MKKSLLLFVFSVLMYGTGVASGPPGSAGNPWPEKHITNLYAHNYLRVGLGFGSGLIDAKVDIDLGLGYYLKEAGLRITVPESPQNLNPAINHFQIRKGFFNPVGAFGYKDYMVVKDNGHVGIGISDPESKLHVHQGQIKLTGNNSYGGPMILFGGSPTAAPYGQWGIEYLPASNGSPGLNFWKPGGSTNTGNYYLFLSDSGQIGMGVDPADFTNLSTSGFRLHVKDGIITEKVKVELIADWADHVFEKEYELLPLHKVESFIKENGHLPNVPSAAQVKEDGIDVAKMDAKLLEKIEELTLYMIEQNRKLDAQEKKIAELERQIKNQ